MKKLITVAALALALLGIGGAASAAPVATLCHDIQINVNGTALNDAACNDLPPQ